MAYDWWDEIGAHLTPNLNELIVGRTFEVDAEWWDGPSGTRTVADVLHTAVGVDSKGMFVGVTVLDTDGGEFVLYGNGRVCEVEDDGVVGSHDLAWVTT